jgi:hypothetical protein
LLLWPAVWNGYPIVFADTGTYLAQAIHRFAGWDRPVFYSVFMLPLHATVTLWPVVVVQAVLAAWILWLVCRALLPQISRAAFVDGTAMLAVATWLPWMVSELMPDVFTPLVVLVVCLLAWTPECLSRRERVGLTGLAAFMIASQQSSLLLVCPLLAVLGLLQYRRGAWSSASYHRRSVPYRISDRRHNCGDHDNRAVDRDGRAEDPRRSIRWVLMILPPALALLGICSINFAAYGRFAVSPFGNIFLLARVIYDGPGMVVLRRDCSTAAWRLCPFLGIFPPTSDEFLWKQDGPLNRACGPKAVSQDADSIIRAALISDPAGEARAALKHAGTTRPVRQWRRPVPLGRPSLPRNNPRFPSAGSRLLHIRQTTGRSAVGASGARTPPRGRSRSRGHGVPASASHPVRPARALRGLPARCPHHLAGQRGDHRRPLNTT